MFSNAFGIDSVLFELAVGFTLHLGVAPYFVTTVHFLI